MPALRIYGALFPGPTAVTTPHDGTSDELRAAVARVVSSYGLTVFDVQFRRESIGWVLRVMIDRPWQPGTTTGPDESVTVDECGKVSQDLSAILDVEPELVGEIDRAYTLEVSSPGLDRPLRGEDDYRRFAGRLAKIVTAAPVEGQSHFEGRLAGVDNGHVLIEQGRRTHRVPIEAIKRARLDIEF